MVKVRKDLTGQKFGKLTVLYQTNDYITSDKKHRAMWHCICDCDEHNEVDVVDYHLKNGDTISCGCYKRQRLGIESKQYNKYKVINDITIIYTNKNEEVWVDTKSYFENPTIREICWCINRNGYVVGRDCKKGKVVSLHDIIMQPDVLNGEEVDHIYGDKWDNRTSKLRIVSPTQNNQNKGLKSNNTSGYTGVYWNIQRNKWYAQITVDKRTVSLGYFCNKADAIKARKEAEIKYFGEYRYGARGDN
jgi:hypothetical protein